MQRNIQNVKLTKSYIEENIDQIDIMSRYLNISRDVIEHCIVKGTLIKSVFRTDDKNNSMGFAFNSKGKLKVRDFGGFGFFGDIYDVVGYVLSNTNDRAYNCNNKQDFYLILLHIANTFRDVLNNELVDESVNASIVRALNTGKNKRTIIEIVPRYWNRKDSSVWEKWNITTNFLSTNFVIPVDQYYINKVINDKIQYNYKSSDPCYAYFLGKDKTGCWLIKLYFPLRNRATELKFITNCNVLEGLLNLELNNYDYILITKSSKDRLSILSYLSTSSYGESTIGVVNLPSESYKLKENEFNYLRSKLKDDGMIFSLLDFDTTGRQGAKYLKETYDIPYLFITRGELGLPNYNAKDFSDLHDVFSKEEIKQFIKETFTYINLVYKHV